MGKRMEAAVLGVVLALSLLGCKESGPEPADPNQSTAGQIKQKANEALQAATDLVAQQKEKLLAASQKQLDKLEQQFGQWAGELSIEEEQAKLKLEQLKSRFQIALLAAQDAVEKARDVSADAWKEAKPGLERAVGAAQSAYDEFVAYIQDQARQEEQKADNPRIEE